MKGFKMWWAPIASAVISALTTFSVVYWIFTKNQQVISNSEWKKERYKLSDELYSMRYILSNSYDPTAAEISHFNKMINRIPYVFANNQDILGYYASLVHNASVSQSTSKDQSLIMLIQKVCQESEFSKDLSADYVINTITVPQNNKK
jgi:hypothetical protein